MESIEFIKGYESYFEEISEVVKFELIPIVEALKQLDPNNLVRPEGYIESHTIDLVQDFFFLPTVAEFVSILNKDVEIDTDMIIGNLSSLSQIKKTNSFCPEIAGRSRLVYY